MKEDTETIDAEVVEETHEAVVDEPNRRKRIAVIAGSAVAGVLALTAVVIIKAKAGGNVVPE